MKSARKVTKKAKARKNSVFISKIKIPFIIFFLITALASGIYYLLYKTDYFLIKDIEIAGASTFVNPTDLWNFAKTSAMEKNILFIDTETLSAEMREIFLGASSIEVSKKYPSTLKIAVTERTPLALLQNETSQELFMVDSEGYLLGTVSPDYKNLPVINFIGELKVGEFVNKDLVHIYYDLIDSLAETKVKSTSMSFHKDHVAFYTPEGIRVLIDNKKDKLSPLFALSQLLKSLQVEDKNPKSIDLRYDKVVVSY